MHRHFLKRKNLMNELEKVFEFPLTVIIAGMGYGKTMAVRNFLNSRNVNYVWLSIDKSEMSQYTLWDTFVVQLGKKQFQIGNKLRKIGFPWDYFHINKVIEIIEENIKFPNTVLIIDDYHYSKVPQLDILIEKIVRANIDNFHILILSRTVPNIGIDELQIKGYCYKIMGKIFEINTKDIKSFFALYGCSISEKEAEQVYEISEGWISAIYLILQRYIESGRLEMGLDIEKLIETSVIPRYSDEEIQLLKSLCLFDSFIPEQVAYMTGKRESIEILRKLSNGNSFIQYDYRDNMYRIHRIFINYLRKLLDESSKEGLIEQIYTKCGKWFIEQGDIVSGLKNLLKGRRYDLIMEEFEKGYINPILDNNINFIFEIFNSIPKREIIKYPLGYLSYIGFYVTNIDLVSGIKMLENVEKFFKNDKSISKDFGKKLMGECQLIRAYGEFNNAKKMKEFFVKAGQLLEDGSSIANKDKIVTFGSPHGLFLYFREPGKLFETATEVESAFNEYTKIAHGCGTGFDDLVHSEFNIETGNYDEAILKSEKGYYKAELENQIEVMICTRFVKIRSLMAKGDFSKAIEIIDDLRDLSESGNNSILTGSYELCSGYIGGILQDEALIPKWMKEGELNENSILYQGFGFNYIVYGKYLLMKKEYLKLEIFSEKMMKDYSMYNNVYGYIHSYIMNSIAKKFMYNENEALKSLNSALTISQMDNIITPFAEYGEKLLAILENVRSRYNHNEYIDKLIYETKRYYEGLKDYRSQTLKYESLTKREEQILSMIVEGKTNGEIANELFLAEVTVRKHITSIYKKLNVKGRAFAIKKAIEMKLL